jgi:hypothetical protein
MLLQDRTGIVVGPAGAPTMLALVLALIKDVVELGSPTKFFENLGGGRVLDAPLLFWACVHLGGCTESNRQVWQAARGSVAGEPEGGGHPSQTYWDDLFVPRDAVYTPDAANRRTNEDADGFFSPKGSILPPKVRAYHTLHQVNSDGDGTPHVEVRDWGFDSPELARSVCAVPDYRCGKGAHAPRACGDGSPRGPTGFSSWDTLLSAAEFVVRERCNANGERMTAVAVGNELKQLMLSQANYVRMRSKGADSRGRPIFQVCFSSSSHPWDAEANAVAQLVAGLAFPCVLSRGFCTRKLNKGYRGRHRSVYDPPEAVRECIAALYYENTNITNLGLYPPWWRKLCKECDEEDQKAATAKKRGDAKKRTGGEGEDEDEGVELAHGRAKGRLQRVYDATRYLKESSADRIRRGVNTCFWKEARKGFRSDKGDIGQFPVRRDGAPTKEVQDLSEIDTDEEGDYDWKDAKCNFKIISANDATEHCCPDRQTPGGDLYLFATHCDQTARVKPSSKVMYNGNDDAEGSDSARYHNPHNHGGLDRVTTLGWKVFSVAVSERDELEAEVGAREEEARQCKRKAEATAAEKKQRKKKKKHR